MMMFHQIIDVLLAVEASVHDELEFLQLEEINIFNEVLDGLYISDVTGKFPVINREHGFFTIQKCKVYLRERIPFFVLSILCLFYQCRV